MSPGMTDSPANLLCKACGLCCSGHLFAWVRLDANELDKVEKLGLKVSSQKELHFSFNFRIFGLIKISNLKKRADLALHVLRPSRIDFFFKGFTRKRLHNVLGNPG